jgi:hypothetical protein
MELKKSLEGKNKSPRELYVYVTSFERSEDMNLEWDEASVQKNVQVSVGPTSPAPGGRVNSGVDSSSVALR